MSLLVISPVDVSSKCASAKATLRNSCAPGTVGAMPENIERWLKEDGNGETETDEG